MLQITALRQTLRTHLGWHGARLNFVALFLIALFRVKTVNFAQLATAFAGDAQTDSNDKRLQRFFRDFDLDYGAIAKVVITLIGDSPAVGLKLRSDAMAVWANDLQHFDAGSGSSRGCFSSRLGIAR